MASKKKAQRPAAKKSNRRTAAKRSAKRPAKKSAKRAAPKKKAARKISARPAAKKPVRKTAAKRSAKRPSPKKSSPEVSGLSPSITVIPEERPENLTAQHAPVDDLTSSGNEVLDIFQRYDRDRTGEIDREEFARLLEALGQNPDEVTLQIALDVVDTERTGKIGFGAFKRWWLSR